MEQPTHMLDDYGLCGMLDSGALPARPAHLMRLMLGQNLMGLNFIVVFFRMMGKRCKQATMPSSMTLTNCQLK